MKTTTAVHLAHHLQLQGHSVCVLDCDQQGSSSLWLNLAAENGFVSIDCVSCDISQDLAIDRALEKVESEYDYVVIDGPGGEVRATMELIQLADKVLIPIQASALDFHSAGTTMESIRHARRRTPTIDAAVFLSRINRRATKMLNLVRENLEQYADQVTILNSDIAEKEYVRHVALDGETVFQDKSGTAEIQAEFRQLFDEFIGSSGLRAVA